MAKGQIQKLDYLKSQLQEMQVYFTYKLELTSERGTKWILMINRLDSSSFKNYILNISLLVTNLTSLMLSRVKCPFFTAIPRPQQFRNSVRNIRMKELAKRSYLL